jgi:hypothetical protein
MWTVHGVKTGIGKHFFAKEEGMGELAKKVFEAFRGPPAEPSSDEHPFSDQKPASGACGTSAAAVGPEPIKGRPAFQPSDRVRLASAPPADLMSHDPCPICGSHERWIWLDGRHICRVCVVLDLRPMSLLSSVNEGA